MKTIFAVAVAVVLCSCNGKGDKQFLDDVKEAAKNASYLKSQADDKEAKASAVTDYQIAAQKLEAAKREAEDAGVEMQLVECSASLGELDGQREWGEIVKVREKTQAWIDSLDDDEKYHEEIAQKKRHEEFMKKPREAQD